MRELSTLEVASVSGGGDAGALLGGTIGYGIGKVAGPISGSWAGAIIGAAICSEFGPVGSSTCAAFGAYVGRDVGVIEGPVAMSLFGAYVGSQVQNWFEAQAASAGVHLSSGAVGGILNYQVGDFGFSSSQDGSFTYSPGWVGSGTGETSIPTFPDGISVDNVGGEGRSSMQLAA